MTFRQLLPDRFAFGRDIYDESSYAITKALPSLIADLQSGIAMGDKGDLHFAVCLLTYAHLGYPPAFDIEQVTNLGVDLALQHFRGQWGGPYAHITSMVDKRPDNPDLEWFDTYRLALLVALLSGRKDALTELADWPEPWMQPDIHALRCEATPAHGDLYLLLVNNFRTETLSNVEEIQERLRGADSEQIQCLHEAWESALTGNQAAFDSAIVGAVRQWELGYDGYCAHPRYCLAEDASTVLAAGRAMGMGMPDLEPRAAARLLTPESILAGAEAGSRSGMPPPQDPFRKLIQDFGIASRED